MGRAEPQRAPTCGVKRRFASGVVSRMRQGPHGASSRGIRMPRARSHLWRFSQCLLSLCGSSEYGRRLLGYAMYLAGVDAAGMIGQQGPDRRELIKDGKRVHPGAVAEWLVPDIVWRAGKLAVRRDYKCAS